MHRRVSLGVVLLVFVWSAVPAAAQAPSDEVVRGHALLHSGAKSDAVGHFAKLLAVRPDDLALQFGWAMACYNRIDSVPSLAPEFERRLDATIALADRRFGKNAKDSEALFYLAQSYMLRATYRFEHDKGMWGAARDGAKAKGYSETFVKQHPERPDGYFVLGLYNYFVDIAPAFLKVFRLFLFLPAGNRVEGLRQLERAASGGTLFSAEAQMMLVEIYSSFEGRTTDALTMGERLLIRYPANDDAAFAVADLYGGPGLEDRNRAASVYQQIIDRRRIDASPDGTFPYYRALLSLAGVRFEQWRISEAVGVLSPIIETKITTPDWVLPQFLLRRGNYLALVNDPAARNDPRRVQADPKLTQWHQAAANQLKWMDQRDASGETPVYAALILGNRYAAENRWDDARRAYEDVRRKYPENPQVKFRLACLQFSSADPQGSSPAFSALAAGGRSVPEFVRASSLLYVARAHDLAGRRADAVRTYQKIVDDYEQQRAAGAARLGLITPYKRPAGG